MLEDEQRFEELEAKLAALSSQVEGLGLEKEIDPFFEDDVRRLIEDFREKEIAEIEESDALDESDESGGPNDFISVQTTGGRTFKVHWISPESCADMTKAKARAAFASGAASRYGTSQQVNSGDVLILLCRRPIPESGSEPTIPEKFCHYIGMAVNTGLSPTSLEPPATDVEPMTSPVGNYEMFVWSSCECSPEEPATVVLPSVFEPNESLSITHGDYASIGGVASPDMSSADGLLTSAEIRKDNATGATDLAKGLSNTLTISTLNAGYKTELVQLSQDLTEYYLDRKTKDLSFNADKKNLNTHDFESDIFTSKSLTLSNGDCLNLETVSISGENFDMALLKESSGTHDSTYLTTAKVSLGSAVSLGDSVAIETFKTDTKNLETNNQLEADHTVFLPVISNNDADAIETSAFISYLENYELTIEARYTVVYESENKGDAEYYFYKKEKKVESASFASGLFYDAGDVTEDTEKQLLGIIRVKDIPLRYGCHETYGCQLDPAGEFYDDTCEGSCVSYPSYILDSGGVGRTIYVASGVYKATSDDNPDLTIGGQGYKYDQAGDSKHELELYSDNTVIVANNHVPAAFPLTDSGSLADIAEFNKSQSSPVLNFRYYSLAGIPGWSGYKQYDVFTGDLVTQEDIDEVFTF